MESLRFPWTCQERHRNEAHVEIKHTNNKAYRCVRYR